MPMRLYRVLMACLRCLYRVCIECYCFHCALTETARSCHGNHCAPAALPRRPSAFAVRLQNDETAMQLRWEQTQQNGTKAASSLPPPLCVQALPTSSWLLNANTPGYSLSICMSSRSRMIQTLCTSFRDECVGEPQGVGEFWYGNGWTSPGGCSMATIIGSCMTYGIKTLPVTLVSYVCHPRRRRVWVRQWFDVDRRLQHGHYHRFMYELRYKDPASCINFRRVPPDMFDELLGRLGPLIAKQSLRIEYSRSKYSTAYILYLV